MTADCKWRTAAGWHGWVAAQAGAGPRAGSRGSLAQLWGVGKTVQDYLYCHHIAEPLRPCIARACLCKAHPPVWYAALPVAQRFSWLQRLRCHCRVLEVHTALSTCWLS